MPHCGEWITVSWCHGALPIPEASTEMGAIKAAGLGSAGTSARGGEGVAQATEELWKFLWAQSGRLWIFMCHGFTSVPKGTNDRRAPTAKSQSVHERRDCCILSDSVLDPVLCERQFSYQRFAGILTVLYYIVYGKVCDAEVWLNAAAPRSAGMYNLRLWGWG